MADLTEPRQMDERNEALNDKVDALKEAIENNDVAKAKELLAANPELATQPMSYLHPNGGYEAAIHVAAGKGNVEMVNAILEASPASATLVDTNGRSAVAKAAYYDKPDALKILLDKNPDAIDRAGDGGASPLWLALSGSPRSVAEIIKRKPELAQNDDYIKFAIERSDKNGNSLETLLTANPAAATADNLTHAIDMRGHHAEAVVTLLKANPALATTPNKDGKTPLEVAQKVLAEMRPDDSDRAKMEGIVANLENAKAGRPIIEVGAAPEPSPDHSHDHSTPLRRTPTLAEALRNYGSGSSLGVISENGPDNMAAISTAIRSDANKADKGSYFTIVREGDRQLVVTGNRTRGLNGRYETTGVYEVQGEGKDAILVPVTDAAVKPNMSFEIARDGQPYMNDPEHPSRPVTVTVSTPAPAGPSVAAPPSPVTAAPGERIPNSLQGSVMDYSTGMGTTVRPVNPDVGMSGQRRISAAVKAASPDSTSYVVAQENGRDIVIAGNVRNGQLVVTQTFNVGPDNQSLVPATSSRFAPNSAVAMNGTSANLGGPSVAAGPSAATPSGPAPSQARQNWDATVATIRQSINQGVGPTTGTELADALRNYANNPVNNLRGTNKEAMLTAANNMQNMSPDQLQGMLSQRAGQSGQTVEQMLTSATPRDNSIAVTSLMRQSLRGGPALANGQQPGQPGQPRVGFNDPSQNYMNGLRSGNAQEAGAALQQLAEQQQLMANATNNPNLAKTALINRQAAQVLQGPNGQQALDQQLSRQVGSGKTVRDMLDSPNQNAQMAAGAFVANSNSPQGQQYNRNTMPAMQLAARMEARLGGNALAANHGNNHGVNGGHDAHGPAGPVGAPGGARRGAPGAGVGA